MLPAITPSLATPSPSSPTTETPPEPAAAPIQAGSHATPGIAVGPTPARPPSPGAPDTALGFVPLDRARSRALLKPVLSQMAAATTVAEELTTSPSYEADFGTHSPPAEEVAALIETAEAWTLEARTAKAWSAYADAQRQLAWDAALRRMAVLQEAYALADGHDATLRTRYPSVTHFVEAKRAVAMRAWRTKRARAKSEAGDLR